MEDAILDDPLEGYNWVRLGLVRVVGELEFTLSIDFSFDPVAACLDPELGPESILLVVRS